MLKPLATKKTFRSARLAPRPVRLRRRRGMVIVATMMVLMFILAIALVGAVSVRQNGSVASVGGGGGIAQVSSNVIQSADTRIRTMSALNLAESGVWTTVQWLSQQATPPGNVSAFGPTNFFGGVTANNWTTVSFGSGTFKVRLYPYSDNGTAAQKRYIIESVGAYQGRTQIIRAAVIQDTLAKYAFFTDNASDNWWVAGLSRFNGPVHINGSNGKAINIMWKNSGTQANNRIFTYSAPGEAAFTTAASTINWNVNSIPNVKAPSTTTEWGHVATMGTSAAVRTNAPKVDLPVQSAQQERAALGLDDDDTIPNYSTIGVTVPNTSGVAKGGVYIQGDVDDMQLSTMPGAPGFPADSTKTQQLITIYQHDNAANKEYCTYILIDPINNVTYKRVDVRAEGSTGGYATGSIDTYSGDTNGVIYVAGNIGGQGNPKAGGLSGVVSNNVMNGASVSKQNALTIVTDADKNMNIDGTIKYENIDINGSTPSTTDDAPMYATGVLGLVSKNVQIVDEDSNGNDITNITVHATVMAYDTFDVSNPVTRAAGSFTLLGGYIAKDNGKFGQFDSANGSMLNGFSRTLNYDSRVAATPPPYFPTSNNQYKLFSYQRVVNTLQP